MKTILLIDSSNECREAWGTFLEGQGCRVVHAASGSEALERWREHKPFDAVVIDLYLPEMNGMAVMETLSEWTSAPVIAVAKRPDSGFDLLPAATVLGAARGLRKPLAAEDLWRELSELCPAAMELRGRERPPAETDRILHRRVPVAV